MRQLLMDTGMQQGSGGAVGVYPYMENAMAVLDTDVDGWIDPHRPTIWWSQLRRYQPKRDRNLVRRSRL